MIGYLPMSHMRKGGIYRIYARNFFVGVWDGKSGFIGIREKFGDRYLFTEYHYDADPHVGTARPIAKVGQVPEGVELIERPAPVCDDCGREVRFILGPNHRWVHDDDDSAIHTTVKSFGTYMPLMEVLEPYAKAENERFEREGS